VSLLVFVYVYVCVWGGAVSGILTQGFMLAKQEIFHLRHTSSPFCSGYFGDGVSQTVCPGWLPTEILLISDSQVAGLQV
jgi:hypothetical protein